jgi:hypothetical protein
MPQRCGGVGVPKRTKGAALVPKKYPKPNRKKRKHLTNKQETFVKALAQLRSRVPELLERHGLGEEALIEKYLKPLLFSRGNQILQGRQGADQCRSPRRLIVLGWAVHVQSFVRTFVVEDFARVVEADLLQQEVGSSRLGRSLFSVRCMCLWRPFCWGWPGLIRSIPMPSLSHQTTSSLFVYRAEASRSHFWGYFRVADSPMASLPVYLPIASS